MTPRPDTEHVCESCGYPAPQPVCVQCALYAFAVAQLEAIGRTVGMIETQARPA